MIKKFDIFGVRFVLKINRSKVLDKQKEPKMHKVEGAKINFGPGPNWIKPDNSWLSVDVDPRRGDVVVDFQQFNSLPFADNSVEAVYGSHVFEHMSIFTTPKLFKEVYRVMKKDSVFRLVLPDAEKSINEYVKGNKDFLLFKRRRERALNNYNKDYTLFECLKEDFLSPSGQIDLLGKNALAHQNAWDFETIMMDLNRAGFAKNNIHKSSFKTSFSDQFDFEGSFESEANQDYRSLYVEAIK